MGTVSGWIGERKTAFRMWLFLPADTYQRRHNIIIPSKNGTTQIDHLIVSLSGIFIIETKNLKGWIFGSSQQSHWTQVIFGHKYQFQNPIRQTYRQRKILAEYLGIDETVIHTVIFFAGHCRFKTMMPFNVINSRLSSHIKSYQEQMLAPEQISQILTEIDKLRLNPDLTTKTHVKSLRERYSSTTICPKCGGNLVQRTAKRGYDANSIFLGCANYPQCRFTRNIG